MIPDDVIDKILDKVDIVEVISRYVPLKKTGQNFKATCPFHKEKTPSFMVSVPKQIYHCFGCGAGGNVISFLMKHERMEFVETIKMLADMAGIALPRIGKEARLKNTLAEKLYEVNNIACDFYHANLAKENNKHAHRYFIERGITESTIKLFRLGFAEDLWQSLIDHCSAKGKDQDLLEKAGLVLKSENGTKKYDRFRNRILFPIFDLRGRVLGFGGRALDNALPKYMNSPETYIYTKGKNLYGLNFSRDYIRRQNYAIIVEGYFDLILPYQHGIRNIVATLGTALTPDHISTLRRFTKNVIMVYDSDKAGEEATLRGLDLLVEEEMNVRIAILPKGYDPDSFVRKEEKPGFMKALKESKDLFDYKLEILTKKFKKSEPRGKARIAEEMLPTLSKIKNAVLKSSYLKKISEELSVDEESMRAELKKVKTLPTRFYQDSYMPESTDSAKLAEMTLLAAALEHPDFIDKIEKELGFEKFKDEYIAKVLKKIRDLHKDARSINASHLVSYFEDDKIDAIISKAVSMTQTIKPTSKAIEDCMKHIKKDSLKKALSEIQFMIKEAEGTDDKDRVNRLVAEYNELIKSFK